MQLTKIKSGKYKAEHHGYVFIIDNQGANVWTISNNLDVELHSDTNKKALVNFLSSYDLDGATQLNQQEFCEYA
jgi:hypothetical protein